MLPPRQPTQPRRAGSAGPSAAAPASPLSGPLDAIRVALCSPDEKLARNAATALNRLAVHPPCAQLLLGRHADWVAGLAGLLPDAATPLRFKPGGWGGRRSNRCSSNGCPWGRVLYWGFCACVV